MSTVMEDDERRVRRSAAVRPGQVPPQEMLPDTEISPNGQVTEYAEGTDGVVRPPIERRPAGRRSRKPVVLGLLAVLAAAGAVVGTLYAIHAAHYEDTDDAFIDGHVVSISPQVPALVKAVHVDDNQLVKKGDLLVELDPTDYQVALDQAKATATAKAGDLAQARAQVNSAHALLQEAQAELDVQLANQQNVDEDYQRYQQLSGKTPGAVSKQEMDAINARQRSSNAQVEQAKAKLAEAQSGVATADANVVGAQGEYEKANADVHKAEVNLSYTRITAPCDGRITRKSVEPGSYVQTGQDLFAIVPTDVWVVANYKETQLEKMKVGQPVSITVDAYPGLELHGHVDSFQLGTGSRFSMLPAENATGNFVHVVQRVPVKIVLDGDPGDNDPAHPLAPGMSVDPSVTVE